MRDWVTNLSTTHYLVGSAIGPHPFPTLVRDFQKVIGKEIKSQLQEARGKLPDAVVACVGGGSNAIGAFYDFIPDKNVRLIGVEAGGEGMDTIEQLLLYTNAIDYKGLTVCVTAPRYRWVSQVFFMASELTSFSLRLVKLSRHIPSVLDLIIRESALSTRGSKIPVEPSTLSPQMRKRSGVFVCVRNLKASSQVCINAEV